MAEPCPCGLDAGYDDCCGRLHRGKAAMTAEQLMRSRYVAYVVRDAAYLLHTWAAATRPPHLTFEDNLEWTALDILNTVGGTAFHTEGTVEFRAHYLADGRPGEQHENSRFVRADGRWVYLAPAA
ncbi:YchJ family protein [Kribbella monticola]|uniref:YchJ family protein n=1 Tax=Kribbella monticola TaxID=2185285 RepID=UPI000DD3FF6A|nr:YchJ family metal-binding protein [Kribbella monticola]